QELIQAREQQIPAYRLVRSMGPDHNKKFTVEVKTGDAVLGEGSGKSKKAAETEAARIAIEQLLTNFTQ
ncbi:putative dsRNA-binding protein, partial [Chloroflexota bacterium]